MAVAAMPRNAGLDLLRLAAALAVVGFHYFFRGSAGAEPFMSTTYPLLAPFALFGYLGVNLFFLISGYVIAWSAHRRSAVDFGLARFVRIYPGFLICMTISFLAFLAAGGPLTSASMRQYLANLVIFAPAFGQAFIDGVYWSIVLEIVFYGWVGAAILSGLFTSLRLEFIAVMLLMSAINESMIGSGVLRLLFVTEFAPLFALGMLAQFIHQRGATAEALLLSFAAFLLSFAHLTITRDWMAAHYDIALSNSELIVSNIVVVGLFLTALSSGGMLRSSAFTVAIGGLTYPLYLLHQNIGYALIPRLEPIVGAVGAASLVVIAIVLVSWLIWRHAEQPAQLVLKHVLAASTKQWMTRGGHRAPDSDLAPVK